MTRYIIRDVATEGCDFLLWGDDDLTAAIISLCQCFCDGIGHDVELVVEEHASALAMMAQDGSAR